MLCKTAGHTVECDFLMLMYLLMMFVDRVGSEFWKQVEQIGDDETGIK